MNIIFKIWATIFASSVCLAMVNMTIVSVLNLKISSIPMHLLELGLCGMVFCFISGALFGVMALWSERQ